MKLSDIPKTDRQFWYVLGETLCNMIRKRVKGQVGIKGSFANLSKQYYEYKKADFRKKGRGLSRIGAGERLKGYEGMSFIGNVTQKANMQATGKMMDSLQVNTATKKHVIFGWLGIHANKVAMLFKTKNYKIVNIGVGDPFAKKEMDFMYNAIGKDIDKKIKAYCKTPIKIKVGI